MELANKNLIDIVKIDTKVNKYIPGQYEAFIVPTILIIYRGKEMTRESKFIDFKKLQKSLDYILELEDIN